MQGKQEANSANELLNRPPDPEYLAEWTALLQIPQDSEVIEEKDSIVIFRLYREWLALSTLVFDEVAPERRIHKLPHFSGKVVTGVVNLRGQLRLSFSLNNLLEIEALPAPFEDVHTHRFYRRMMAIKKEKDTWVFPVDEIYGVYHYDKQLLQNVPSTVAKSAANFFKGILIWNDRNVGYIDEELLFANLKRRL